MSEILAPKMRAVKQQFFSLRNGVVADALRKAGNSHQVIFGLNLPQIKEIAHSIGADTELARELWADVKVRESQMLAPYLWEAAEIGQEQAIAMLHGVADREIADVLCLALLRRIEKAEAVAITLLRQPQGNEMTFYIGLRLALNLLAIGRISKTSPAIGAAMALDAAKLAPALRQVLIQISEEVVDIDA